MKVDIGVPGLLVDMTLMACRKVTTTLCRRCASDGWEPIIRPIVNGPYVGHLQLVGWRISEHAGEVFPGAYLVRLEKANRILTLRAVTEQFLIALRTMSRPRLHDRLVMQDYHGFQKARLPEELVALVLKPYGMEPTEIQAEIVRVRGDLSREKHHHKESRAFNVILGQREHFEQPIGGRVFLDGRWFDLRSGDRVEFPMGVDHGFTVRRGGKFTFLSVQSPPIVGEGHDDYVRTAAA